MTNVGSIGNNIEHAAVRIDRRIALGTKNVKLLGTKNVAKGINMATAETNMGPLVINMGPGEINISLIEAYI